jgi:hypothetical protein
MRNAILSILAACLLVSSGKAATSINIVLDASTRSGPAGSVLHFTGTLTNTTGAAVYLNGDNYNLSTIPADNLDDRLFFSNTPAGRLAANGTSGDIGLFNVTIPGSTATGSYSGSYMIVGGAANDSQDILGVVNFTVQVVSGTPASACDIDQDGAISVADVQRVINEALTLAAATDDLNHDGAVDVADVQIVLNSALGLGCAAQ